MNSGIYCIRNIVSGKIYIGQSKSIKERKNEHLKKLRKRIHHNSYLQRAFDKYGEDLFQFTILTYCEENELNKEESYYISKFNSTDKNVGYNLTTGGDSFSFSDESLKKMSKTRRQLCQDKDYLIKMSFARSTIPIDTVKKIKEMLYKDYRVEYIAEVTSVSYNIVRHIKDIHSFSFVLPKYNYYIKHREEIYKKRRLKNFIRMYRNGYSFVEMAEKFNVNQVTPYRIVMKHKTEDDERQRNHILESRKRKKISMLKTMYNYGKNGKYISKHIKMNKDKVNEIIRGIKNKEVI
ncbi:GIY-YIG nuclease family protein [Priestia megaterium]|uniref:GIY-YIG nuclease family protein n=1 Tax=Priestia megaterium TaxID=1404 RepID=UPI001EDC2F07|nr:GIY-YIG nuclease family protein [Priestia megaterium]UKJ82891.1 GIY-YIG nuclease family protein [Priestia megaterium]